MKDRNPFLTPLFVLAVRISIWSLFGEWYFVLHESLYWQKSIIQALFMTFCEILVFFFSCNFQTLPNSRIMTGWREFIFYSKTPRSKISPILKSQLHLNLYTLVVVFHIYQLFCYSFPLVFSRSEGKRKSTVLYAVLRTEHHILLLNNRWFRLQDMTAKPFPFSLALWHSSWDNQ